MKADAGDQWMLALLSSAIWLSLVSNLVDGGWVHTACEVRLRLLAGARSRAERFLQVLLSTVKPVEDAETMSYYSALWDQDVKFVFGEPEAQEATLLLSTCFDGHSKDSIEPLISSIQRAVLQLHQEQTSELDRLVELTKGFYEKSLKNKRDQYCVLLPQEFNVFQHKSVEGRSTRTYDPIPLPTGSLEIVDWDDFEEQVNYRYVGFTWDKIEPPHNPKEVRAYAPLAFLVRARSKWEAELLGTKALNVFVSLIALKASLSSGQHPLSFLRGPIRGLKPPPFVATFKMSNRGKPLIVNKTYSEPALTYERWTMHAHMWDAHREFLSVIPSGLRSDSTARRLIRALEVFSEGVQAKDTRHAFFALWNTLEILAEPPRGNTAEVCKRVAALFGNSEEIEAQLGAFSVIRNQFVHEYSWVGHEQEGSRLFLAIVAQAIARYRNVIATIRDNATLAEFYEMRTWDRHRVERVDNLRKLMPSLEKIMKRDNP